jgi:hypothetical protein
MASESVYSQISDLIPLIWQGALDYAKHSFVATQYVTVYTDLSGMVTRNVTEYHETGVTDNLGETADLSTARTIFDRSLLATLTPKEIGKQVLLTDRRIESDLENVMVDAARAIGYEMGRKIEQDVLNNFTNFMGGQVGATGSAFDVTKIFEARAVMEANAHPGPYVAVIHPYQYLDIYSDLTNLTKAAPLDVRNQAMQSYYVTRLADVDIVVSSLTPYTGSTNEVQTITVGGSASGGTYTLTFRGWTTSALAHDANDAAVEAALEALPSIGSGNVSVSSLAITFEGDLAGQNVPMIIVDDNVTGDTVTIAGTTAGAGYATGGFFTQDAIALDIRRGLRIEPERDASARATELNASAIYASGLWRGYRGIKLLSDATAPTT